MKFQKIISGLCVGLVLTVSLPKPAKAEPISLGIAILKIIGVVGTAGMLWVAMKQVTLAENNFATDSLLKHLEIEKNAEFPINGTCVSPDIKNGKAKKAWLVSIDDNEVSEVIIKSLFCKAGGLTSENGKYIIGAFTGEHHAQNFAKIVKHRTQDKVKNVDVFFSTKSIEL